MNELGASGNEKEISNKEKITVLRVNIDCVK